MPLPASVKVRNAVWSIDAPVRDTGASLSGQGQRVLNPSMTWRLAAELVVVNAAVQDWRAWLVAHRGGIVPDMLGPWRLLAPSTQPWVDDGGFSDDTVFTDGTVFLSEAPGGAVPLQVVGAHAAGAAAVTLNRLEGPEANAEFAVATYIGLGSRLYQIDSVTDNGPLSVTLGIWPPLRAALADGAEVDAAPRTKMRLTDPKAGWVPDLMTAGAAVLPLELVEDLSSAAVMA